MYLSSCRRLQGASPQSRPELSMHADSSICHLRDAAYLLTETRCRRPNGGARTATRTSILPPLFFDSLSSWPTGVENKPFSLAPCSAGLPCSQHAAMWPDETAKLGGACCFQMSLAYG